MEGLKEARLLIEKFKDRRSEVSTLFEQFFGRKTDGLLEILKQRDRLLHHLQALMITQGDVSDFAMSYQLFRDALDKQLESYGTEWETVKTKVEEFLDEWKEN